MFMYQLLKSIYHMHKNGIFHRDVKPENILVKVSVNRTVIAIAWVWSWRRMKSLQARVAVRCEYLKSQLK
jgi:serine/threonine protein kinase